MPILLVCTVPIIGGPRRPSGGASVLMTKGILTFVNSLRDDRNRYTAVLYVAPVVCT